MGRHGPIPWLTTPGYDCLWKVPLEAPCSRIIWFVDAVIGNPEMAVFLTFQAPANEEGLWTPWGDTGRQGRQRSIAVSPCRPVARRSPLNLPNHVVGFALYHVPTRQPA